MILWITGLGVVSPLADNAYDTMDRLCLGHCAFREVTLFDVTGLRSKIAAQIHDLPASYIRAKRDDGRLISRTDVLAIAAADQAIRHAKLDVRAAEVSLVVGSTTGPTLETECLLPQLLCDGSIDKLIPEITNPLAMMIDNLHVAFGPFTRSRMVSSACSSGATALALAGTWLRSGLSQCVLAGASDALCRLTYCGFHSLGSLDSQACRPFDATRAGLSLGEAAAFFVIETKQHALARGVEPICELAGWCGTSEAHHITNPQACGAIAAQTMIGALRSACIPAEMVDYVNAHATATILHDPMELRAMRKALGEHFDNVLVSSTKGQVGHTLGAAGALEAAICAMSIEQQRVAPTAGLRQPAADCQANHVIGVEKQANLRAVISNSFGFGGLDTSIVLAHPTLRDRESCCQLFQHPPTRYHKSVWVQRAALAFSDSLASVSNARIIGQWPQYHPRELSELSKLSESSDAHLISDAVISQLNPARSRRLSRAERLLSLVVNAAVNNDQDNALTNAQTLLTTKPWAVVVARLSGNPDAMSVFLDRIEKLGPRFASPAEFPNLMLSSTAGHVAIYNQLQGMTFATCAVHRSACAAISSAFELAQAGYPEPIVAGAVENWGMLCEAQTRAQGCQQNQRTMHYATVQSQPLSEAPACQDTASNSPEIPLVHCWPRTEGASAFVLSAERLQAIARLSLFKHREQVPAAICKTDRLIRVAQDSNKAILPQGWDAFQAVDIESWLGINEAGEIAAMGLGSAWIQQQKCKRVVIVMQSDDGILYGCLDQP